MPGKNERGGACGVMAWAAVRSWRFVRALGIAALLGPTAPSLAQTPAAAPALEFAFEAVVLLGPPERVGQTALGGRTIIPIVGGTFKGPSIAGTIVPGGWDWQLRRADGCSQVKADYMIRTDDGVVINVVNTGVLCPGKDGSLGAVRTHPVFEPPVGKYAWLGQSAFIGTLQVANEAGKPAVRLRFYKVV
jgi:hypothetical protein